MSRRPPGAIAADYGFDEWITPIFEDTRVFSRTLGETSDVVTKEMYTFDDRGGDSITLRPEATAGICRALVSNGLTQSLPKKVFCTGPMFRYERPQKGRYRQFHQIDIELIGPSEPLADAEVIACGWDILKALGVAHRHRAGTEHVGRRREPCRISRGAGRLFHREQGLRCRQDSLVRLERNPMRILDSKDPRERDLIAGAPKIWPYLSPEAAAFYGKVQEHLSRFGVPFRENPGIVRGLDYYGHTAFEFVTSKLGAQGTVMAGGRYDGLVSEMGGPATPAVGLAAGVERLAMLLDTAPPPPHRSPWCRSAKKQRPPPSAYYRRCAPPASAPRWRIAAISAAGWSVPIASTPAPPSSWALTIWRKAWRR